MFRCWLNFENGWCLNIEYLRFWIWWIGGGDMNGRRRGRGRRSWLVGKRGRWNYIIGWCWWNNFVGWNSIMWECGEYWKIKIK